MSGPRITRISTENAPAAKPFYSQAVRHGNTLYVSGCLGADKASGELSSDFNTQAKHCLENLKAVIEAGGSSLASTVKVTVLLARIQDYAALNEIYKDYFPEGATSARTAYAVAGLPLGALVEIDAIAAVAGGRRGRGERAKKAAAAPAAAAAQAPSAEDIARAAENKVSVFVGKLPENCSDEQVRDALQRFGTIVQVSKAGRGRVVKFDSDSAVSAAVQAGSNGEVKIGDDVIAVENRKGPSRRRRRQQPHSDAPQTTSGTESESKAPRRRRERKPRKPASDAPAAPTAE